MTTHTYNYKSDFSFILEMTSADGTPVGWPDYDWRLVIKPKGCCRQGYTASCVGGIATNCVNDGGRIRIICDRHGLGPGELQAEFFAQIPNAVYPDGRELNVKPFALGITLVTGAGDESAGEVEVRTILPYIYVSAYEIAVANGYEGTAQEYVNALVAAPAVAAKLGEATSAISRSSEVIESNTGALGQSTIAIGRSSDVIEQNTATIEQAGSVINLLSDLSKGKAQIARALTEQGVPTEADDTMEEMAENVRELGKPYLTKFGYDLETAEQEEQTLTQNILAWQESWQQVLDGTMSVREWKNSYPDGYKAITICPPINTSGVTNMSSMFYQCSGLMAVPKLDTSGVTSMDMMFSSCSSLKIIELLDTSNATGTYMMFYDCNSLKTIPLLDTRNSTLMGEMFTNCYLLHEIPELDTSSAQGSLSQMFHCCYNLETLPQSLETSAIQYMNYMFCNCKKLQSIPDMDTQSATTMERMFDGCTSLQTIPRIDMSSATNISSIFGLPWSNALTNLTTINITNLGKQSSVTATIDFSPCTAWVNGVVDSLLTNSFDRASARYASRTLKLSSTTKAVLTDEQKAAITAKGYTIS